MRWMTDQITDWNRHSFFGQSIVHFLAIAPLRFIVWPFPVLFWSLSEPWSFLIMVRLLRLVRLVSMKAKIDVPAVSEPFISMLEPNGLFLSLPVRCLCPFYPSEPFLIMVRLIRLVRLVRLVSMKTEIGLPSTVRSFWTFYSNVRAGWIVPETPDQNLMSMAFLSIPTVSYHG